MKQLLVLSGKGGTGKTTVASALIRLLDLKAFADCDVDAPNLHLINQVQCEAEEEAFYGLQKSYIDQKKCTQCGACELHCRFSAIEGIEQNDDVLRYQVSEFGCEGCGVCEHICPTGAAKMIDASAGDLRLFRGEKVFSTAKLKMGNGTTGMLVTEVKKRMNQSVVSDEKAEPIAIIDGSPGIGCPVIASISGVDLVLIVAEPSVSGISDLRRIVQTTSVFGTMVCVCVNKWDISTKNTERITAYCKENNLPFVGKIPFDPKAMAAVNQGLSIADIQCPSGQALACILQDIQAIIEKV